LAALAELSEDQLTGPPVWLAAELLVAFLFALISGLASVLKP
jgi:hypothetical protein